VAPRLCTIRRREREESFGILGMAGVVIMTAPASFVSNIMKPDKPVEDDQSALAPETAQPFDNACIIKHAETDGEGPSALLVAVPSPGVRSFSGALPVGPGRQSTKSRD
jgi:hypothetical protein